MSRIDWLIAAVIAISIATAATQGFLYESFSLVGAVVAYLAAAWGYPRVALWCAPYVTSHWVADIAGFLTIFVGVVLLAGIAGRIARWGASGVGLQWADRLLGGVFGLLRGILISAVLLLAITSFASDSAELAHSSLGPYVLMVARMVVYAAPAQLRERFNTGMQAEHRSHPQDDKTTQINSNSPQGMEPVQSGSGGPSKRAVAPARVESARRAGPKLQRNQRQD